MKKPIPDNVLSATAALLRPYIEIDARQLQIRLTNSETPPPLPHLLDKHDAARHLGLSWYSVVAMCKSGELRGIKIRGVWRIPASEIERVAGVREGGQPNE